MTTEDNEKFFDLNIEDEMRTSYLDYSMSVIVSRALPDVRDGLKPVHRRILWAMNDLGMSPDKPHRKSARVVGDVLGKYHPHGDSSVYGAMVRLAQNFNTRYLLADGHGNFGSVDGDGAAAMRYTEVRMTKLAMEMLKDINKELGYNTGNERIVELADLFRKVFTGYSMFRYDDDQAIAICHNVEQKQF